MDLQLNSLNIKLQPCTFEQAKALKELGFPQETDSWNYYDIEGKCVPYLQKGGHKEKCCEAPTLELAAKWLREKKNIDIIPLPVYSPNKNYFINIYHNNKLINYVDNGNFLFGDYEQALSAGITKAIEMLKQQ